MWVLHLTSNLWYNYVSRKEILVSNTHNLPNKSSSSSFSSLRNIDDRCNGREIGSLLTEARYTPACNHPLHWGLIYTWYGLRYLLIFTLSLQSPPLWPFGFRMRDENANPSTRHVLTFGVADWLRVYQPKNRRAKDFIADAATPLVLLVFTGVPSHFFEGHDTCWL